ncbi:MAG: IS66 family transposase [Anaeromicrobium sp.]|jgi:transposase|uniref:IS66 family transposase n=1 Tax=Anaeromicrobium sp. TaxID=1929132 RepID=UPI0025E3FE2D|nr:IS66 family transposase [Anaeromicrobium sp.]MCT4592944.1 IS66 family transposase [Anaeromicrobium sp.]
MNTDYPLDDKTQELIDRLNSEIESKENELDSKDARIKSLEQENAVLKGIIKNNNKKIYGNSSEKIDSDQLSIFNEAEASGDLKTEEPAIEEITYTRKKSSKKTKDESFEGLETVVIEHKLDDTACPKCNDDMHVIGKKSTKKLKFVPAKLYIEEHVVYSYACRECEKNDIAATIVSAKAPKSFIPKSMATNELLSHILYLKYSHAMPLNRQESYFKMLGANLSRQTLSNWVLKCAEAFDDIYRHMKIELLSRDYIHADETTVMVINEKGKECKSKKYMWLYKTGTSNKPVIIYDYQSTRSSTCAVNFLKGYCGYLQTDGYKGYGKVENVKWISCLAHIRRKFHNIIDGLDKEALKISRAYIGFEYCEQLYHIEKELKEHELKKDYYDIRHNVRLEKSKQVLEDFISYVDIELPNAMKRSALEKALKYAKDELPKLRYFLEDGRIEIDNNSSERSIKSFVIGRKNWLFMNSRSGAKASARIYSILETAKANGLKIDKYLEYLMDKISNLDENKKQYSTFKEMMPWSKHLPKDLYIQIPEQES